MAPSPRLVAIASTAVAALFWGTSFPANQKGLETMEPGFFVAARFAVAALVVLPFSWRLVAPLVKRWEPWALGAINAVAFFLQYTGQVTAPAGASGLLINANVVVVALVAWALLGERPSGRLWFALALALAGASLIMYEPGAGTLRVGHAIVFLAGALWSFYIVGTRAVLLQGFRPAQLALATFVTTGALLSPFLVLDPVPALTAGLEWGLVLYTGVACTVLAFLFWLKGLEEVGATVSAVVLLVEVFVAAALGAWLLDETFPARKLVGGLAIALAIVVLARPRSRRRGTQVPATARPPA